MTANEFHRRVIKCDAAYCMTMPGTLVPITRSTALVWFNDSLEQTTYKPTVQFHETPAGSAVIVGCPMGHGEEVKP